MARQLDADVLLPLTDVAAVQDGYGTPQAHPIRRATPTELRARNFPAGSMGPKIEAVCAPVASASVIWPSFRKTKARNVVAPGIMMSTAGTNRTILGDLR